MGRQHPVIAHQVETRGRHQSGQLLDELEGRQHNLVRAVRPGSRQLNNQLLGIDPLQTTGRQRRANHIATICGPIGYADLVR